MPWVTVAVFSVCSPTASPTPIEVSAPLTAVAAFDRKLTAGKLPAVDDATEMEVPVVRADSSMGMSASGMIVFPSL